MSDRPKSVFLFNNGMVVTFDKDGEQMAHYQGKASKAAAQLRSADLSDCEFVFGVWLGNGKAVSQEEFFKLAESFGAEAIDGVADEKGAVYGAEIFEQAVQTIGTAAHRTGTVSVKYGTHAQNAQTGEVVPVVRKVIALEVITSDQGEIDITLLDDE